MGAYHVETQAWPGEPWRVSIRTCLSLLEAVLDANRCVFHGWVHAARVINCDTGEVEHRRGGDDADPAR